MKKEKKSNSMDIKDIGHERYKKFSEDEKQKITEYRKKYY